MSKSSFRSTAKALRAYAMALPEAKEEFPWGERVVKVNKKIFVFLGMDESLDDHLHLTVKLPSSAQDVLDHDFAKPTGYGLGKSGWVTIRLAGSDRLPTAVLTSWIDESYRAIAPKRLLKPAAAPSPKKKKKQKKTSR